MSEQTAADVRVEELGSEGDPMVHGFLQAVPRGEYLFLKEDLDDSTVWETWRSRDAEVFLAYLGDKIAGLVAVIPGLGWSSHVGDLRMVVSPGMRGRGVGAALARRALDAATAAGLQKVSVEVLADQESVSALFAGLGFTPEALLADHVRDDSGELHDLLVLSHPIRQTLAALAGIGMLDNGGSA